MSEFFYSDFVITTVKEPIRIPVITDLLKGVAGKNHAKVPEGNNKSNLLFSFTDFKFWVMGFGRGICSRLKQNQQLNQNNYNFKHI